MAGLEISTVCRQMVLVAVITMLSSTAYASVDPCDVLRDNAAGCNTNGPTPTTLAARTVQPSPSKSHGPIATATGAPPDVDESGSKALSSGAILGIFLAAIVIVGSIVGAFVVVRLRNKERERQARERQSIKIRTSGSHSFERTDTWKMDDRPLPSRPPPCHQFV